MDLMLVVVINFILNCLVNKHLPCVNIFCVDLNILFINNRESPF